MGFFNIKKIITIVLLISLCGCTATYEIEIKDNKIYEHGNAIKLKSELDNNLNNSMTLEEEIDFTLSSMHDKNNGQEEIKTRSFILEKINTNNEIGLKYENNYEIEKFINSPILKQCYDSVTVDNNEYNIKVSTSNKFNCFDYYKHLKKVTVILTTNYKVVSSNHNKKIDNKYYWYIDRNNQSEGINIDIEKKEVTWVDELKEESVENNNFINYILICLGVCVLISGVIIFIKIKNSNK